MGHTTVLPLTNHSQGFPRHRLPSIWARLHTGVKLSYVNVQRSMLDVLNGRLRVETLILFSVCLGKQSYAHTHQYLLRLALPGPHEHSLNSLSVVYQISCAGQEVMPRRPHSFTGMIHHFLNCIAVSSVLFLFLIAEARVITFFFAVFYWVFLVDIFVSSFSFRILHFNFSASSKYLLDLYFQVWHFSNLLSDFSHL